MKTLCDLFVIMFMTIALFKMWDIWSNEKYHLRGIKKIGLIIVVSIMCLLNYRVINDLFKIINIVLIFILANKLYMRWSIKKSLSYAFYAEIIFIISESIYAGLFMFLFKSANEFVINHFGSLSTNIIITILTPILVSDSFKSSNSSKSSSRSA